MCVSELKSLGKAGQGCSFSYEMKRVTTFLSVYLNLNNPKSIQKNAKSYAFLYMLLHNGHLVSTTTTPHRKWSSTVEV